MGTFAIGSELKESLDEIFKLYWELLSKKFNYQKKYEPWIESIGWMGCVQMNREGTLTINLEDLKDELGTSGFQAKDNLDLKIILGFLKDIKL